MSHNISDMTVLSSEICMHRTLFLILFVGTIWIGHSKVENLVATLNKPQVVENTPTIGLGPFLQLVRAGNIAIIDMRPSSEYNRSHIKNALSMHQLSRTDADVSLHDDIDKARNVILYSNGGVNDQMRDYAKTLSKRGIKGATFYSGGFREWLAAGLPVEKQ